MDLSLYETALKFLPKQIIALLAKANWRFAQSVPVGTYRSNYCGFSVELATQYPVEKKMLSGTYCEKLQRVIRFFVKPNMVCMDVGANAGAVSLLQAKLVGSRGKVIALEPGPLTADRLEHTIRTNSIQQIQLIRKGLSDKAGTMHWCLEQGDNLGNATLSNVKGDVEVQVTTMDELIETLGLFPEFIKVDVEGMELEVFRGGKKFLSEYLPTLFFETLSIRRKWDKERDTGYYDSLEDLLHEIGYTLFAVTDTSFRRTLIADTSEDTIAVATDKAKELGLI